MCTPYNFSIPLEATQGWDLLAAHRCCGANTMGPALSKVPNRRDNPGHWPRLQVDGDGPAGEEHTEANLNPPALASSCGRVTRRVAPGPVRVPVQSSRRVLASESAPGPTLPESARVQVLESRSRMRCRGWVRRSPVHFPAFNWSGCATSKARYSEVPGPTVTTPGPPGVDSDGARTRGTLLRSASGPESSM